jgi:hypothetical protein
MKIRPLRAKLFHAGGRTDRQIDRQIDRQTDMTKLIAAIRNFSKPRLKFAVILIIIQRTKTQSVD